jgi:hypothetical protein
MTGAQIILTIYHEFIQYYVSNGVAALLIMFAVSAKPKSHPLPCSICLVKFGPNTDPYALYKGGAMRVLWHNALFVRFEMVISSPGHFAEHTSLVPHAGYARTNIKLVWPAINSAAYAIYGN